jgi:hypothetical protein
VLHHLCLRRPVLQNQSPVSGSLQEPIGEERLHVRVGVPVLLLAGATYCPQVSIIGVVCRFVAPPGVGIVVEPLFVIMAE